MLMTAHGVGRLDFAFDNAKRRLGATHVYRAKNADGKVVHIPTKITLSKHYVLLLPEDEVRDVMLHEIAHALTPNHGHDHVWRAAARKIGAKGTRCATPSAAPPAPIAGMCPKCSVKVSEHHRKPRAAWVHKTCRTPLVYHRNGVII